jgi:hypothetical protein
LRAALQLEPEVNLFLIHRDADSRNPQPRYAEIRSAVSLVELAAEWVALVPIQETEAWLLLDEAAIRLVARKPSGTRDLLLPKPRQVETVANPKERLQNALVTASELSGRKLAKFKRDFPDHRRILLQRLPIRGMLADVPSWVRLETDLKAALARLTQNSE